ncbi:MAG TPA: DNA polymerase III subunit gamma/tau [Anaerolineales bacterium]|nr:DNA polymerase III subunit gamma/tau [Anaerolineales bacterium]
MSQALYRKWRPQGWDEVVGQDHVVQTLRNAVGAGRVGHAYLFSGPRGTGKTTTARLLAKAVNCEAASPDDRPCNRCSHCVAVVEGRYLDLIEIDAASNTSVEDVRDLRDKINFAPNEGEYKVYIVDEVHMLSTAAFNALLKTLEEPPAHAIFVLATTEVHKIPATVLSRCQRHEFRRIPLAVILEYLRRKLDEEGLEVEAGVLELVSRQATGSLRDAISLLDQLASAGGPITVARAEAVLGTAAGEAVGRVVEALVGMDVAGGLTWINKALDGGADPRQFARQLVDTLRGVLLARMGNPQLLEVTPEARTEMARWAEALEIPTLLAAIRAFNKAAVEGRSGWQPGLALELAFVESARGEAADPPGGPPPAVRRRASQSSPPPPPEPGPKAAAPLPRPAAQAASSGELTFPLIVARWRDVLAAARKRDPRTQALLNSCRPLGLEGGVLVLGFASDLLRDKMEKGHSLALAREALEEVFGVGVEVRSALTSGGGADGRPEAPVAPMEADGMVATALRDLGAQVVEVKPMPPDDAP